MALTNLIAIPNGDVLPSPGTSAGATARKTLIATMLEIGGDVRFLHIPQLADGASITSVDRNALTITAVGTPTYSVLGSGALAVLNGTSQYFSVPDNNLFTFGDGTNDEAFSIVMFIVKVNSTGNQDLLSRYDITTGATQREFRCWITSGTLELDMWDDSAGSQVGRSYNVALANSNLLLTATYDGSKANPGAKLYSAAAQIDNTNQGSGTYTAMENKTPLLYIGASRGASAVAGYANMSVGVTMLTGKVLTIDDQWAIKAAVNAYYGLTL